MSLAGRYRALRARALTTVARAIAPVVKAATALSGVSSWGNGSRWVEWKPGSWQQDVEVKQECVIQQATVYACITLIAQDVGKLRLKFVELVNGIWVEGTNPAYSPVLTKPNHFQTRQQFVVQWILSLLTYGNTYALKERDARGVVSRLYILDPCRVRPLIAPDGAVYYALQEDDLNQVPNYVDAIPASEIIHDRLPGLFHPLVGVTPIFACGLPATQALAIQKGSAKFFSNASQPGGILTAPEKISDETAARIKAHWQREYSGDKAGRVAVLGDGLAYTPLAVNAVDSQLVDQLRWSDEKICSVFHVPGYKVGVGPTPTYQNAEVLNQIYFTDCLQTLIKGLQSTLAEGLGLDNVVGRTYGVHCDLDELLLMDTRTKAEVQGMLVQRGIAKIDEARARFNLPAVPGGDTPYLQQQNFALEALAKRDASDDPFGTAAPPAPTPAPAPEADNQATRAAEAIRRAGDDAAARIEAAVAAQKAAQDDAAAAMAQTREMLASIERAADLAATKAADAALAVLEARELAAEDDDEALLERAIEAFEAADA